MELPRLVMKFGGTSVADAQCIVQAARLVRIATSRRPAVIVSAAVGVTDQLDTLIRLAAWDAAQGRRANHAGIDRILDQIEGRHRQIVRELSLPSDLIQNLLRELRDLARGIALLGEVTPRTQDLVLSYGERLLADIFSAYLNSQGVDARSWNAGDLGLITDDRFSRARPLPETFERIPQSLRGETKPHVPVITGFLGRTREGHTTTLGRGGSDYTASLVGRAVAAEEVQIWTDVDGILTADPRVVPGARLIEGLTFREAGELAYSGAKVLHPSTITPAMEGKIPVRVLNSFRPESPGTTIVGENDPDAPTVRAIAHKFPLEVITIVSPRMLARHGFIARIAAAFDRRRISIDMISTSEVSVSLTTDEPLGEGAPIIDELRRFSNVEVTTHRGMVSVVGGGLGKVSALVGEVFGIVAETRTEIDMISLGATRTNLSFLLPEARVPEVVTALHEHYFEG